MRAPEEGRPLKVGLGEEIDAQLGPLREQLGKYTLSEYAFSNLYLFRSAHSYRYLPGPYPCVAGMTYDGTRHLMPLFDLCTASSNTLAGLLCGYDCFFPIAENALEHLDRDLFTWSASPDDSDYLYPAANFRGYEGERLRKKRNLMQQLLAVHRLEVHSLSDSRIEDAMTVLARWMRDKDKAAGEADEAACSEALRLSQRFGFDSLIYYADGAPVGFLIAQPLAQSVAAMRFAKGSDFHKGIYQYMFHHYCTSRIGTVEWLNFEQDLGLANFRQTKRSYEPCALLSKFRVRLKK